MPDCPNGHGALIESVAANTTGNDIRNYCPDCDFEIIGHTLYPHNDPEHPRYKHRHGLSEGAGSSTPFVCGDQELTTSGSSGALAESVSPGPNPTGICQCGCGKAAPVAESSDARKGHIRGQPMRFIHGHGRRANFGRY